MVFGSDHHNNRIGRRTVRAAMGLFYETFVLAIANLWGHKLRSFLTLLGIVIGIMAIVGMTSLLRGLDLMITADLRSLSPSAIIIIKFGGRLISSHKEFMRMMNRPDLKVEDAEAIRLRCKSVKKVDIMRGAGFPPNMMTLKYKNSESNNLQLIGVSPFYMDVGRLDIEKGRFFTEAELMHRKNVIVLGSSPAQGLFKNVDPIGKEVSADSQKFTVVGTFPKRLEGGLDTGEDDYAAIPYTTYEKYFSGEHDSIAIAVLPEKEEQVEQAQDEIIAVLRIKHRLKSWQENDFDILTKDSLLEFWKEITRAIIIGLVGISSVALLVGGVGVMAIMMVSVTERIKEIGIRKAIGATNKNILSQFLLEAVIITSLGGIFGVIVGALVAVLVSLLLGFPISLPLWSFVAGVLFSSIIGILSGMYPAYKASKLNPIDALHYE